MAKICIDPGHYGKYNRCPAIPQYYESEMVWKLSYLQKKYLEQMGHTVVMTRTDPNKDLNLVTRGKKSNGCDLFISNHSNAVGGGMNESVSYAAIYHLVNDTTTKCDDVSKEFASKIAPVIGKTMGISYKILTRQAQSDRNGDGIKNDNYYGVLHGARLVNTPGLILEHGFHTNTACVKWLLDDNNLDKLAKAEAECINEFFGGAKQESNQDTKQEKSQGLPYKVKINTAELNVRKGAGTNYPIVTTVHKNEVYTIVSETMNEKTKWGRLKSGAGYISLSYTVRV